MSLKASCIFPGITDHRISRSSLPAPATFAFAGFATICDLSAGGSPVGKELVDADACVRLRCVVLSDIELLANTCILLVQE
ncbi:MAG: hypothetical protein KJ653_01860, partial [Candidatus Thermoplasmatota archaeon]|nr:hypothetical protein [Candidatus Thermoplasmatota archaeon]